MWGHKKAASHPQARKSVLNKTWTWWSQTFNLKNLCLCFVFRRRGKSPTVTCHVFKRTSLYIWLIVTTTIMNDHLSPSTTRFFLLIWKFIPEPALLHSFPPIILNIINSQSPSTRWIEFIWAYKFLTTFIYNYVSALNAIIP